ncbi:DUF4168 domain-containing protein [Anianabacter salinae]|uniref:DUF4168 domain-containing protein n=1 Tax=Anianabacter salinae TaxID=2851023 RepID=UPI00225E3391|nr:DUF4168 domain-containing protein [Anianabacter salinae]MBV0913350.1 DUF4168 domain-containing protein [Anianabacter salinae]
MELRKTASVMTLAALMAGAAPVAAVAQMQDGAAAGAEVSDGEIDAFIVAYEDVLAIDEEYGAQMQQVSDQEEMQRLQEEAQIRKAQAVEAAPDIEVDRYVEILTIAQNDPDLTARIVEELQN